MRTALGAVLAGGVGSRVGGGKVRAELHGQALISYPLAAIEEAGLEAGAAEPLVVPPLDGRPQPLLARYEPALLPELEAALVQEEPLTRGVEALQLRLLGAEELARFDGPHRLLFNVNDRDDLREAEAL
jgi:molybdopterin-guanine dinucleotide biosynthesis protein A